MIREPGQDEISGWFQLLEQHAPAGDAIVRVYRMRDGETSVTLPLLREHGTRFGMRRLRAMQNYYTPDFRPLCSAPAARMMFLPLLVGLAAAERPDSICLSPLDPDAPETDALRDAFSALGWPMLVAPTFANWVQRIESSYEHFLSERSSRVRNTLRRKRRRLMGVSGVSLNIVDGTHDLDDALERYRHVYARSWKRPEAYEGFVPALIEDTARRGRLRLGFVSVDGTPIAVHFWLVKDGCAYIYKLAHDLSWDRLSPGTVLLAAMLEHVHRTRRSLPCRFSDG